MFLTKISAFRLIILAICFVIIGLYFQGQERSETSEKHQLILIPSVQSFGSASVGEVLTLKFSAENRTSRGIRVIGCESICFRAGCLMAEGLPVEIPPGQQRDIEISVYAKTPGEFDKELAIFTDNVGQHRIVLGVEGQVVEEVEGSLKTAISLGDETTIGSINFEAQ